MADLSADIVGTEFPAGEWEYTDRDVMLYALGVGAKELEFIYEGDLKVLPTFAVIPTFPAMGGLFGIADNINPAMILHGEQSITLHRLIPVAGTVSTKGRVASVYDKGASGAVINIETETRDSKGELLFNSLFGIFARGAGGFGGDRGPKAGNLPPNRPADKVVAETTAPNQNAIYRLSGDRNPLHIDPDFAAMAGYERPILHGLCSYGFVGRAILREYCGNDPARFKHYGVRFSKEVYPGDTLVTEFWEEGEGKLILRVSTQDGRVVLSNCVAEYAP